MCGHVLKERPRGQDHGQAVVMLQQVTTAPDSARALRRLLDDKDASQYGTTFLGPDRMRQMLRRATTMVEETDAVLGR